VLIRVTRPKIFHFLETNLKMARPSTSTCTSTSTKYVHVVVDVHVLVIGFLIWLSSAASWNSWPIISKNRHEFHEFHEKSPAFMNPLSCGKLPQKEGESS